MVYGQCQVYIGSKVICSKYDGKVMVEVISPDYDTDVAVQGISCDHDLNVICAKVINASD